MTVRIKVDGREVPDMVNELVAALAWQVRRDQLRAALRRTWLPVYGGLARNATASDRWGW